MIGSSSTGSAFSYASLNAIEPAILNAISEESTVWYEPSTSSTRTPWTGRAGELAVHHRLLDPLVDRRAGSSAGSRRRRSCPRTRSPRGPRAARGRCGSRRTGRDRRSASCSAPCARDSLRIVSRYGTRGWCSSTSTPKRRLIRSTATSTCICAHAREELLARLLVAAQDERRVLLGEPPERRARPSPRRPSPSA